MLTVGELVKCLWLPYFVLDDDISEMETAYEMTLTEMQARLARMGTHLTACRDKLNGMDMTAPLDPEDLMYCIWQVALIPYPDTELDDVREVFKDDPWELNLAGHRLFAALGKWQDLIAEVNDEAEDFNEEEIRNFLQGELGGDNV